jgi:CoA:oxalate CoA-transferase
MALADTITGLHGAVALLAALRVRDLTGAGQHVDLSMLEAMVATDDYAHYALDEAEAIRDARGTVLTSAEACVIVAADGKVMWRQLCRTFGLRDPVPPDSDLETKISARRSAVEDWARGFKTSEALGAALAEAGLAWGHVRQPEAVPNVGVLRARRAFQTVASTSGPRAVVRMPYHFSAARSEVRGGVADPAIDGPLVVQEWLNCGPDRVAEWVDQGALLL